MAGNQVRIAVKVTPGASRNAVAGQSNGAWRIRVAAPPDKGKANRELIEFLSDILSVRKAAISIISGQTGHNKMVIVEGLTAEEIARKLAVAQSPS